MLDMTHGIWNIIIPVGLFMILATVEAFRPRRALAFGRQSRWMTHIIFFLGNAVIGRLLAFIIVVASAANWAQQQHFGLFNLTNWPWWIEALLAFILLDFAVWLQHLVMHKVPLLWRAHCVHHSDPDMDVTTALRFHPFELIVSTLYKSAWVAMLGVPVIIALAFELWLSANALFNHSNIKLPVPVDRMIRPFLVTPDMHLVHHSTDMQEQHKNYGFALTIWDRLAGTYAYQSASGRDGQQIGLAELRDSRPTRTLWSFALPFRKNI
jgi:sterol desaturase/sphingolipid hydroxylase (fatty acid hydroxylase superfamily)